MRSSGWPVLTHTFQRDGALGSILGPLPYRISILSTPAPFSGLEDTETVFSHLPKLLHDPDGFALSKEPWLPAWYSSPTPALTPLLPLHPQPQIPAELCETT